MEEQLKRYDETNESKALPVKLEAARNKYIEEMDKVCYFDTHSFFLFNYLPLTISQRC